MSTKLLYTSWLYNTKPVKKKITHSKRKKLKLSSSGKRLAKLQSFAKKLNKNLPQSEVWFQMKLKEDNLLDLFKFNYPLKNYIVDAINFDHKIIVEIDGGYHQSETQKIKDQKRDIKLIESGWQVFRIKAFSTKEYDFVMSQIKDQI